MSRQRRALPLSDWPESDRRLWQRAFERGALFDAAGAGAHWAASTRAQVANGYGLWLGYLASTGGLQANDLPCARLDVRRLQGYVADLSPRLAPVSVASRLRDLAEALRVMQPDGDRRLVMLALRRLERAARPSRDLRSRLVAPTTLYEAGIARMARLMQAQDCGPRRRAIRYSDGLRIAMLAAKHMQRSRLDAFVGVLGASAGDGSSCPAISRGLLSEMSPMCSRLMVNARSRSSASRRPR